MKTYFCALGICIALSSACRDFKAGEGIQFKNLQPEGGRDLERFPGKLHGAYLSLPDSGQLEINDHLMLSKITYQFALDVNKLDSGLSLSGDTLLVSSAAEKPISVKRIRDSIYGKEENIDTLFSIDKDHILRKLKDHYILNSRKSDGWVTQKLQKGKRHIVLSEIEDQEVVTLKELSDSYTDTIPYQFLISSDNLKRFVNAHGYKRADTFRLISSGKKQAFFKK